MKLTFALLLILSVCGQALAAGLHPGKATLLCHRTANEDVPENTLESLEQAALLGCDVVEIDLRRTLDGRIILNHDGVLERLTDGVGDAETTFYDDLRLRDAGSWMGDRFAGLHIATFDEALRLARQRDIRLILDIKTKGIGAEVLQSLRREGMLERVSFGGEWEDVKRLYPSANADEKAVWVQPGVTADQVLAHHRAAKAVIANFSDSTHAMDLESMKAAVSAGVDGINVDFPRLGADAVGRPVELKINTLIVKANQGELAERTSTILELAHYRGFALESSFTHWLLDENDQISRAAAIALITARPLPQYAALDAALQSQHANARANAAWALGMLSAPAKKLQPLLQDADPHVVEEALLALARAPGDVSIETLQALLSHTSASVRGAAAIALARHHPDEALKSISAQLRLEVAASTRLNDDYVCRGKPQLTQEEIATITGYFRCEMKMLQAISMLRGPDATQLFEEQAFHAADDFTQTNSLVAGFQLWDRIEADPASAAQMLASDDIKLADRAEWILVQAGPAVLPVVRRALSSNNQAVRERAIKIVAWQGDSASLPALRTMPEADAVSAAWAIETIELLHPQL